MAVSGWCANNENNKNNENILKIGPSSMFDKDTGKVKTHLF